MFQLLLKKIRKIRKILESTLFLVDEYILGQYNENMSQDTVFVRAKFTAASEQYGIGR